MSFWPLGTLGDVDSQSHLQVGRGHHRCCPGSIFLGGRIYRWIKQQVSKEVNTYVFDIIWLYIYCIYIYCEQTDPCSGYLFCCGSLCADSRSCQSMQRQSALFLSSQWVLSHDGVPRKSVHMYNICSYSIPSFPLTYIYICTWVDSRQIEQILKTSYHHFKHFFGFLQIC